MVSTAIHFHKGVLKFELCLFCHDFIMSYVELCPAVDKAIDVTQIQEMHVWMSFLFLSNFPDTVVGYMSAR